MSALLEQTAPTKPASNEVKRIRQWIASGEPHVALDVLVTPEIAATLLSYNKPGVTNRNLSPLYLRQQARVIEAGGWHNTGEPVIMSKEGILNDGQHRLELVVRTGIPCVMDLRFGVPREAFADTNTGRKRTAGDVVAIMGYANGQICASSARLVLLYEMGLPENANFRIANGEVERALHRWPDLPGAIRHAVGLRKHIRNASTGALAFFATRTANEASVAEFFSILRTGEGAKDNPPHALREFLQINYIPRGMSIGLVRIRVFACCIYAWNAWQDGRQVKLLKWTPETPFPQCKGLAL